MAKFSEMAEMVQMAKWHRRYKDISYNYKGHIRDFKSDRNYWWP